MFRTSTVFFHCQCAGQRKKGEQREEEGDEDTIGKGRERMGKQCKGRRGLEREPGSEKMGSFPWHIVVSKLSRNMTY